MQNYENMQPAGNLKISRDVIATIARFAALEVDGVESLPSVADNLRGLLKAQSPKPVVITLTDDIAVIDIFFNIRAGVNIPQVAEKVQSAVKEAVQNMTGIAVSRVNVTISGIVFDETVATQHAK